MKRPARAEHAPKIEKSPGSGRKRAAVETPPSPPGSAPNEPEPEAEETELPVLKKPACKAESGHTPVPKGADAARGDEATEPSRSARNKLLRTDKFGDWTVEWYKRGTASEGSAVKVGGSYSKYISPKGETFWSKRQAINNGFAEE